MGRIAKEILGYLGTAEYGEALQHYGVGHLNGGHSGRYPYGSGEDPNQRDGNFYTYVQELKKAGMTEKQIVEMTGCPSTTVYRARYAEAKNEIRLNNIAQIKKLYAEGKTRADIARELNVNESTIRSWEDEDRAARSRAAQATADALKKEIESKGIIDVGDGVERELGVSKEKLNQALLILEQEGYMVYGAGIRQVTNKGQQTIMKVVGPKDTTHAEVYDFENVHTVKDYTVRENDEGIDIPEMRFQYPTSIDSSRVKVVRPEEGGSEKDGLIGIKPGSQDLDLKGDVYAQVRIMVDNSHYLKGMAVYEDASKFPDGVDVLFYTSKPYETHPTDKDVFKKIKDDPENPFGSAILTEVEGGQYHYIDNETGESKLGAINKRAKEGDWGEWGSKVPSQFLSKQPQKLIDNQLKLTEADYESEFEEICSLTNPAVRKKELLEFAGACDTAAVDLKAASFPRQAYQVLIPINSLKDNECYAPNYHDGETLALVRYPHGGTFEIPIVKVNNKNPEGIDILGKNPKDAIGINANTAKRLSGADFDGDCAMIIPCNSDNTTVRIHSTDISTGPFSKLKDFDPHMEYAEVKGMKYMSKSQTGKEMGIISNLITDMTLKGASDEELVRAVKHSMVIIDAEKHRLNYKQSEIDNGIEELKKKYQLHFDEDGNPHYGSSTLISRAKSPTSVEKTRGSAQIDPETGKVSYKLANETYIDPKTGKEKLRMQPSKRMKDTDDAYTLVSDARTPQELAYADFANYMKDLANRARKEYKATGNLRYDPNAKAVYADEVKTLEAQLELAMSNAPRERAAQRIANVNIKAIKESKPNMTPAEEKKLAQRELVKARTIVGAHRREIKISDRQWEAIQSGAITENKLQQILRYADGAEVKKRAMPRTSTTLSPAKQRRIEAMKNSGYTNDQIAQALGVSTTTVNKYKG